MLAASGLGEDVKATRLVTCVTDMVKMCPGKYYDFMSLPLFKEQWLSPLHELITNEYEISKKAALLCKKDLPTDRPDAPIDGIDEKVVTEDKINSDDEAYEVFRCPCGQCSLESYIEDGCPKSNSDAFPYLDISKLDEDDKEDLTQQLSKDTTAMIKRFANLLDETSTSLAARRVSVQRLALRALTLGAYESEEILKPILSEDEQKLMNSGSIDEAFLILRPHMSFFNFELLKHITDCKELCSDSDRERMDGYVSEFDTFCKRKVFEVSPGAVGQTIPKLKKRKRRAFVVLMTKHEAEPNLVFVNAAKQKLATLLKLKPSTLHLHRIDEGSIILVFSVPNFVAKKLFPLKPSPVARLKDEGFLVLAPPTTEESYKDKSVERKRMSWPLRSKEKEVKVTKTFSLDSLYVKDDSRRAFLLLFSAQNGKTEIIQALVGTETNQDILYSQWNGMSALMLAAQGGHTKTVRTLLNAGAEAPAILDLSWRGHTALMMAAQGGHTMTVQVLIEAGADVTRRDITHEETALMLAAQGGHTETIKALIEAGADVNLIKLHDKTALMLAAQGGHTETVKALIDAGAKVNLRNMNKLTALKLAAQGGHTETVKALIEAGADVNLITFHDETALMLTAQGGLTETVKALIEAGADVNLINSHKETALILAARGGHTETVKALIDAGAKVNLRNMNNLTALKLAAQGGHTEMVKALIEACADVNLKVNFHDETALMLVAQGGHTEMVKALIEAGADVNLINFQGKTALMLAAQGGHTETVKALIEAGADVNLKGDIILYRRDKTALMLAAQGRHTETVKALIEAGADVNLINSQDETALMLAAQGGHTETVKALIEVGADVNLINRSGETALMLAAQDGYTGTIETLIAAGAPGISELEHNVAATDDLDLQGAHPWSTTLEPQTPSVSAMKQKESD